MTKIKEIRIYKLIKQLYHESSKFPKPQTATTQTTQRINRKWIISNQSSIIFRCRKKQKLFRGVNLFSMTSTTNFDIESIFELAFSYWLCRTTGSNRFDTRRVADYQAESQFWQIHHTPFFGKFIFKIYHQQSILHSIVKILLNTSTTTNVLVIKKKR